MRRLYFGNNVFPKLKIRTGPRKRGKWNPKKGRGKSKQKDWRVTFLYAMLALFAGGTLATIIIYLIMPQVT